VEAPGLWAGYVLVAVGWGCRRGMIRVPCSGSVVAKSVVTGTLLSVCLRAGFVLVIMEVPQAAGLSQPSNLLLDLLAHLENLGVFLRDPLHPFRRPVLLKLPFDISDFRPQSCTLHSSRVCLGPESFLDVGRVELMHKLRVLEANFLVHPLGYRGQVFGLCFRGAGYGAVDGLLENPDAGL